nr:hypothetical protein [Tanacetum cinerariifolium]
MAPKKRTTRALPAIITTTNTPVTNAQLKALIDQGVADALAAPDADKSMNGDDSHNSGMGGRRTERTARECNYTDFLKFQPLNFKGTEGVVGLMQWFEKIENVFHISNCTVACQIKFETCTLKGIALTWWNSQVKTVTHDVAYVMTWKTLKKMMIDKYNPRGEIKKLKDAIEFATELMDKKISTIAERQAKNKRKLDNNNQPPKKQGVAISYTVVSGKRKEYAKTLPLCNKCKFYHNRQCTRNLTCYECGNQGHYRSDCPELKNQNYGNQAGGTGARGMVHALGGGETNQDLNNIKDDINA